MCFAWAPSPLRHLSRLSERVTINLCLFIRWSYARWARASDTRRVVRGTGTSFDQHAPCQPACMHAHDPGLSGGRVPLLTFVPQGGARGGWTLARVKETVDRTPRRRCWPRRLARPPSPPSSAKRPSLQLFASLERRTGTGPTRPRLSGQGVPGRGPETSTRLRLQRPGVGQRAAAGTG